MSIEKFLLNWTLNWVSVVQMLRAAQHKINWWVCCIFGHFFPFRHWREEAGIKMRNYRLNCHLGENFCEKKKRISSTETETTPEGLNWTLKWSRNLYYLQSLNIPQSDLIWFQNCLVSKESIPRNTHIK